MFYLNWQLDKTGRVPMVFRKGTNRLGRVPMVSGANRLGRVPMVFRKGTNRLGRVPMVSGANRLGRVPMVSGAIHTPLQPRLCKTRQKNRLCRKEFVFTTHVKKICPQVEKRSSGADPGFVERGGAQRLPRAPQAWIKVFGGSRLKTLFGISKGGRAPCAPPPNPLVIIVA